MLEIYKPILIALLLQAGMPSGADWSPLVNLGAVGIVLGWFMFRSEPRLKAIEKATDRQTRAMLLLTLSIPNVSESTKQLSEEIINEIRSNEGTN